MSSYILRVPASVHILILLFSITCISHGQTVYYHPSNADVYEFLDELATEKIIDLNSVIKPYSRKLIAEKLHEADSGRLRLTVRQQKELKFYLKDFNKELLFFFQTVCYGFDVFTNYFVNHCPYPPQKLSCDKDSASQYLSGLPMSKCECFLSSLTA